MQMAYGRVWRGIILVSKSIERMIRTERWRNGERNAAREREESLARTGELGADGSCKYKSDVLLSTMQYRYRVGRGIKRREGEDG